MVVRVLCSIGVGPAEPKRLGEQLGIQTAVWQDSPSQMTMGEGRQVSRQEDNDLGHFAFLLDYGVKVKSKSPQNWWELRLSRCRAINPSGWKPCSPECSTPLECPWNYINQLCPNCPAGLCSSHSWNTSSILASHTRSQEAG